VVKVRLIYEQIEAAKTYLLNGSLLGCRLSLILLDNAAELMMHRELEHHFAREDKWSPKWEPARTEWLQAGRGPKYTPEERNDAQREFEPKTRILCIRLGRISDEERRILNVCHKLRCEAFHSGKLRHPILEHVSRLLYVTVVELTLKLRIRSFMLPGQRPALEDANFLERFGLVNALALVGEDGLRQLADRLLADVDFDPSAFSAALSDDLVESIDRTLQGLEYVGETSDRSQVDRNLQYTQFWRDKGAVLAESGVREPDLESAYRRWQEEGCAIYTLHKIDRWRRQAEAIRRCKTPARALGHYWGVDRRLRPLEDDVAEAVFQYDERINSLIHSPLSRRTVQQ